MNLLFLSAAYIPSLEDYGMYQDMLRVFFSNGYYVRVVCPAQPLDNKTYITKTALGEVLKVHTGKMEKNNIFQKGLSTLLIEKQFIDAINKHYTDVKFDLVIYSTPPITFVGVIDYIKKRDGAKTYLLLKDIFPQNAVDLGMMSKSGIKGLIYRFFRNKEKKLYAVSDRIGCMSPANCEYLLSHNPEISSDKVEVCPNSIEVLDVSLTDDEIIAMRNKYGIPCDKTVFVYGGNLGKPQGIPFIIECLKTQEQNADAFFLIVGDGTEFNKLEAYFNESKLKNMKLMKRLPKEDYDKMIAACDVGMIFLDYRFTIPNFPSRLLSYMQAKLPVFACTDPNTDIGKVIVEGGFGWWCESNSTDGFKSVVDEINTAELDAFGDNAFEYLKDNYACDRAYHIIAGC